MKNEKYIDILLSCYNGERWVDAQIDSFFQQTYPHWKLIARDDGSQDGTLLCLKKWQKKHPEKIFIDEKSENLGIFQSFSRLASFSQSPLIVFSDQDDVWYREKLEKLKNCFSEDSIPKLVCSDLEVVDQDLKTLSSSFWEYIGIARVKNDLSFNRLLGQSFVTGCATMFNQELLKQTFPVPKGAIMHDWWMSLVAARFGVVEAFPEPLVKYRQHGNNVVGAQKLGFKRRVQGLFQFADHERKRLRQAQEFLDRYNREFDEDEKEILKKFVNQYDLGYFERLSFLKQHKMVKKSALRGWVSSYLAPLLMKWS